MSKGARNRQRRAAAAAAREDLEPGITAGLDLPVEVVNNRLAAQAETRELQRILEPRIDGHVLVYQSATDSLIAAHERIAESMEFGMQGRTRWTAVWELAGRCLALCNCMLVQIRGGFASEVAPTMRAIHEANQLLRVVGGPGEAELLMRWLDSKDIGVQQARSAVNRIEKPAVAFLARQGISLEESQIKLSQQVYDTLSAPAHNMRVGFSNQYPHRSSSSRTGRIPTGEHEPFTPSSQVSR